MIEPAATLTPNMMVLFYSILIYGGMFTAVSTHAARIFTLLLCSNTKLEGHVIPQ